MMYFELPGEPEATIWRDALGNSGVMRAGDDGWADYQLWLAAGNEPVSATPEDPRAVGELQDAALQEINRQAEAALAPITRQYPRGEMETWSEQCQEARAWLLAPATPTPLLDAIAGPQALEAKTALCQAVLAKADAYKVAAGAVIRWRRAVTRWVDAQTEREALLGWVPQYPEVPHAPQ